MNDIIEYLYNLRNRGSTFGIERMLKFVDLLKNPQDNFPVIHVAGTNGKGSVCCMLDSIYQANGYKVGLFTSPHLVDLGERIKINGKNISLNEIEFWVKILIPIAKKLENADSKGHPTFFEFMTAIAFLSFKKNNVDIAIIETGLGGRLDSTNVVNPIMSIITTISKDHCSVLGDSLEEIAAEKAGIIKQNTPVLVGYLPHVATKVIEIIAKQKNAAFSEMKNLYKDDLPQTNLQGFYQKQNAGLALYGTELLKEEIPVNKSLSLNALKNISILGRWQVIDEQPKLILDACHNSAGASCLRENLESLNEKPEVWIGVLGEERALDIMNVILSKAESIKLFEIDQPRSCSFEFLRSLIPNSFTGSIVDFDLNKARTALSSTKLNHTILITGSIYLIGDVLSIIKRGNSVDKKNWNDLF